MSLSQAQGKRELGSSRPVKYVRKPGSVHISIFTTGFFNPFYFVFKFVSSFYFRRAAANTRGGGADVLRRSLWKNNRVGAGGAGSGRGAAGQEAEAARGGRRLEAGVERRFRRLEAVAARRPGVEEAAREAMEATTSSARPSKVALKDRLASFKAERAARRAADMAARKQPFRVGVYRLDGKFPPPSAEKKGLVPNAVRSAALRGRAIKYETPSNKPFLRKGVY